MSNPGNTHWLALKWVLGYLKWSVGLGLKFQGQDRDTNLVEGFVDADYAGGIDTRKSTTGFVFIVYGAAVSWRSMLQPVVALSTTEAEYMAVTKGVKEAMWLRGMLSELGLNQHTLVVFCDKKSVVHLSKHQVFHERSKHIDIKLHFVRDIINGGTV